MVRTTSAWCMYEFPTMSFITYILVFTTWFLMLCLFLMIARTLMFSKTFSIVFDVLFEFPGLTPWNKQHNLSLFLLSEEITVIQAEVLSFFIFCIQ